jgi:predicted nucleic-acid-binding protein
MIGIDTNILVRYLTHDEARQTAAATKLLDSLTSQSPGFISLVVVTELVWVLTSLYDFAKPEIDQVLETLLLSDVLIVEGSEIVWQALRKFRNVSAGFSDCLIEECGRAAECEHTLTFDKHAVAAGMRLLPS